MRIALLNYLYPNVEHLTLLPSFFSTYLFRSIIKGGSPGQPITVRVAITSFFIHFKFMQAEDSSR